MADEDAPQVPDQDSNSTDHDDGDVAEDTVYVYRDEPPGKAGIQVVIVRLAKSEGGNRSSQNEKKITLHEVFAQALLILIAILTGTNVATQHRDAPNPSTNPITVNLPMTEPSDLGPAIISQLTGNTAAINNVASSLSRIDLQPAKIEYIYPPASQLPAPVIQVVPIPIPKTCSPCLPTPPLAPPDNGTPEESYLSLTVEAHAVTSKGNQRNQATCAPPDPSCQNIRNFFGSNAIIQVTYSFVSASIDLHNVRIFAIHNSLTHDPPSDEDSQGACVDKNEFEDRTLMTPNAPQQKSIAVTEYVYETGKGRKKDSRPMKLSSCITYGLEKANTFLTERDIYSVPTSENLLGLNIQVQHFHFPEEDVVWRRLTSSCRWKIVV